MLYVTHQIHLLKHFLHHSSLQIRNSKKLPIAQRINCKILGLEFIFRHNLESIFHFMFISHWFSKWTPTSNLSHLIHTADGHANVTIKILFHVNPFETPIWNPSVTSSSLMRSSITSIIKISFLLFQTCLVLMICTIYLAVNNTRECMMCIDVSSTVLKSDHQLDLKILK